MDDDVLVELVAEWIAGHPADAARFIGLWLDTRAWQLRELDEWAAMAQSLAAQTRLLALALRGLERENPGDA